MMPIRVDSLTLSISGDLKDIQECRTKSLELASRQTKRPDRIPLAKLGF
jgi:hypothetical protein